MGLFDNDDDFGFGSNHSFGSKSYRDSTGSVKYIEYDSGSIYDARTGSCVGRRDSDGGITDNFSGRRLFDADSNGDLRDSGTQSTKWLHDNDGGYTDAFTGSKKWW